MINNGRRGAWILLGLLVGLLLVPKVSAQGLKSRNVTTAVAAGERHVGNLYVFGDEVRIEGTVEGDVVSAAFTLRVGPSGQIRGDLLAAAYAVEVDGQVSGDLRAAAYMIEVDEGKVGGDLAVLGFSSEVQQGGAVGQDVLVAGYQLLLDGTVAGNVRFSGAALQVNGSVEGNVDAKVAEDATGGQPPPFLGPMVGRDLPRPGRMADPGLTVGPEAAIGGSLTYTSTAAADVPANLVAGATTFHETLPEITEAKQNVPTPLWLDILRTFLALAILGLLALWLLSWPLGPAAANIRSRPVGSVGFGLLTFVANFAALVALFIIVALTLVVAGALRLGGELAMPAIAFLIVGTVLMTFGLLLVMCFGTLATAYATGSVLLRNDPVANAPRRVLALLLGVAVVAVLVSLPWGMGLLLGLVISLGGLGGLVLVWLSRRAGPEPDGRATQPQAEPA